MRTAQRAVVTTLLVVVSAAAAGATLVAIQEEGGMRRQRASGAQEVDRERLIEVARAIMEAAGYCALITLDESGAPQARAMDPFPPGEGLVVWMATSASTRKVAQLQRDDRATLYYFDREGGGYVSLLGRARIVDDPADKARLWKPAWDAFYDDANRGGDYVLVEFVPTHAEIVSVEHQVAAAPKAWKPATVRLR